MRNGSLLPNFIICGVPKAGTSSLFTWISDHPDTLGSSEKETYYFVDPDTHMYRPHANILNGLSDYSRYFPLQKAGRGAKVILEATPAYIYYSNALNHIPALPSKPRCLFVLREPAEQIYSLFKYFQNNWDWVPPDMTFQSYLEMIGKGTSKDMFGGNELAANALEYAKYVNYLVKWREKLGSNRIMVKTFNQLREDQKGFVMEVAEWLGLDKSFYVNYEFPRENETYAVKNKYLQRLNLAIRGLLPKNRIYEVMRKVYRNINTTKPGSPSTVELELQLKLSGMFADSNQRLREEFGLELPGWA